MTLLRRLCALLALVSLVSLASTANAQAWPGRLPGTRTGLQFISAAAASYVGPVSNNTIVPTSTLTTGMSKQTTIHTVRAPGGITDLQLVEPGWTATGTYLAETPLGANYTYELAVEYPVGSGTWTRITTGGSNVGTCVSGTNCYSDLSAITIPDGGQFRLWECLIGTALPQFTPGNGKALATDEGRAASAAGSCGSPAAVTDTDGGPRRYRTGAVAIFGHRTGDSVAIAGDSQTSVASTSYTATDEAPSDHNRGDIASTIGSNYAYVLVGVGADQWTTALWNYANRLDLARHATVIIDEYGINEFVNKGQSAATYPLAMKARAAPMWSGKKVIYTTITPRTTGTWTSADGSDQTLASFSTVIPTYNAGLTVNGAAPLDRFSTLQNTTTANKWVANGTAKYGTVDGLHLSTIAMYTLMPANAAAWKAQIDALTPATFTQPSMDLTGTGTYSGGYLVNGTATITSGAPGVGVQTAILRFKVATTQTAQIVFWANNGNPWVKTMLVNTSHQIAVQNATGTTYATSTATVNDGVEHELATVDDGTTQTAYLDGTSIGSATYSHATAQGAGGVSLLASTTASTAISIREVSLWSKVLYTGTYTPALFSGNEAGLVALWHLSTSGTATLGPVLPQ